MAFQKLLWERQQHNKIYWKWKMKQNSMDSQWINFVGSKPCVEIYLDKIFLCQQIQDRQALRVPYNELYTKIVLHE